VRPGKRAVAILAGVAVFKVLAVAHLWFRERALLDRLARSWQARVAIEGPSMEPTIAAGDWLLVDPLAYVERPPDEDDLVLAPDPRDPGLMLIKRVVSVDPDGWLRLEGDDPMHSTDSRIFGAIDPALVAGRPWFRYWPPNRVGRID
jgi:nickel-type superoxide dismutase maturation protease